MLLALASRYASAMGDLDRAGGAHFPCGVVKAGSSGTLPRGTVSGCLCWDFVHRLLMSILNSGHDVLIKSKQED